MITSTFCHIPGIGEITEKRLWSSGLHSWDTCSEIETIPISRKRKDSVQRHIEVSRIHLEAMNPSFFGNLLPSNLHWRLFPEFRDSVAYVDIETTGLDMWDNSITTIALYDGNSISYYVQGENLEHFVADVEKYKILVTYNGKCFDVRFIESYFRTKINHAHIDLRYVLKSLGYSGGLKGCEKQLGIDRGELDGVDGFFAVLLWNEFERTGDRRALQTLLAYNIEDVVNLESLMIEAYNQKLRGTPFEVSHQLELPARPEIPFKADLEMIQRVKTRM